MPLAERGGLEEQLWLAKACKGRRFRDVKVEASAAGVWHHHCRGAINAVLELLCLAATRQESWVELINNEYYQNKNAD